MVKLTLAAGHYDRTEALRDGRVRPEGIALTYLLMGDPVNRHRFYNS
jgi:hypothetical protein